MALTLVQGGMTSSPTLMTSQASTSGTNIDFTGIPSWVKRITVMFNDVSLSGTAYLRIQLGVGGVPETSGYISNTTVITNTLALTQNYSTAGVDIFGGLASYQVNGTIVFTTLGSNLWVFSGVTGNVSTTGYVQQTAGKKPLAGVLNMVRITSSGSDTFDLGSVNILYEG
jgi:hypothetical protein